MTALTVDCKVCRHPNRRRLIEADWADGMSAVGIAKVMEDSGWPITSSTILKHLKEHAGPEAAIRLPPRLAKRDANVFVRDRIMDRIEELEAGDVKRLVPVRENGETVFVEQDFDILDPTLQPALNTMVKAQGNIDKVETSKGKMKVDLFIAMLGGAGDDGLAPLALSAGGDDDDEVIE